MQIDLQPSSISYRIRRTRCLIGRLSMPPLTALLCAVGIAFAPATRAADPQVLVTVEPAPDIVTFSRPAATPPLTTYSAYRVKIVNNSTNVLNNVRFTGTTNVALVNSEVRTAAFLQAVGATCQTTNPAMTSIECAIGQLRGGGDVVAGASAEFVVIFKAPEIVASPVLCPAASCDKINFATETFYSEGSSDSGGASHKDMTPVLAVTNLGTFNPTEVKSSVPPNQQNKLFTGSIGAATSNDKVVTSIVISSSPFFTEAAILENEGLGGACAGTLGCVSSRLTIPHPAGQYFSALAITLSRDASTLVNGAKASDLKVVYQPDDPLAAPKTLEKCTVAVGPAPGAPCITYVKIYGNQKSLGDLAGDAEIGISAVENGSFRF